VTRPDRDYKPFLAQLELKEARSNSEYEPAHALYFQFIALFKSFPRDHLLHFEQSWNDHLTLWVGPGPQGATPSLEGSSYSHVYALLEPYSHLEVLEEVAEHARANEIPAQVMLVTPYNYQEGLLIGPGVAVKRRKTQAILMGAENLDVPGA